ncbi:MAG TPA: hypothetical protein VMK53_05450 [Gemmatimonadales bacterium]|nr:hypothetical protein [Gemmatimonadales bacterium]
MRGIVMLAVMMAMTGCSRAPSDAPEPGQIVALWDGKEPGRMRVGVEALHCARDSTIELLAFHNDRAVGLAFYLAGDSLTEGTLPVGAIGQGELPRPSVTGVFRAVHQDALGGYQGREGEVILVTTAGGVLTGRFSVSLTERTTMDPVTVRGAFREVAVVPAPEPCGRRPLRPEAIF